LYLQIYKSIKFYKIKVKNKEKLIFKFKKINSISKKLLFLKIIIILNIIIILIKLSKNLIFLKINPISKKY